MQHERSSERQEIYRNWLAKALKLTNKKPTPFATDAGLSASTILRALDPKYSVNIKEDTIDRLAAFYGIAPPTMPKKPGNGRSYGFAEPEIVRLEEPDEAPNQSEWEVKGRSLDLAGYLPGDIATLDQSVEPVSGDVVIAQIYDLNLAAATTVIRRFQSGRAPYLMTASTDPDAMSIEPEYVDNERVKIIGTVIRNVRSRLNTDK